MANWKELITDCMLSNKEGWEDVESCTLSEAELNGSFDDGFGGAEGKPFTLWTKNRVYFPAVYDGAEWVASVPRNPCSQAVRHVGGE